jgi:hypothetical protein
MLVTLHISSSTHILPIDPPRSTNACLSVEYSKLVEPKLLLQLTSHGNARRSSANNDNRVVRISIVLVSIDPSYGLANHLGVVR